MLVFPFLQLWWRTPQTTCGSLQQCWLPSPWSLSSSSSSLQCCAGRTRTTSNQTPWWTFLREPRSVTQLYVQKSICLLRLWLLDRCNWRVFGIERVVTHSLGQHISCRTSKPVPWAVPACWWWECLKPWVWQQFRPGPNHSSPPKLLIQNRHSLNFFFPPTAIFLLGVSNFLIY